MPPISPKTLSTLLILLISPAAHKQRHRSQPLRRHWQTEGQPNAQILNPKHSEQEGQVTKSDFNRLWQGAEYPLRSRGEMFQPPPVDEDVAAADFAQEDVEAI